MWSDQRGAKLFRSLAELLSLALILEASGYPKPGNVHRISDGAGLRYEAFLATGVFALKYFELGIKRGYRGVGKLTVGDLIYGLVSEVISRTKSSNTCLGSSLLLSLMSVSLGKCIKCRPRGLEDLVAASREIVELTTEWDAVYYYRAIRRASPSYIKPEDNTAEYVNVWDRAYRKHLVEKRQRLVDVLRYSSKFDVVAREAVSGFAQGLTYEEFLRQRLLSHGDINRAIVETYLYILSLNIDTVVLLKHGERVATEISRKAKQVLDNLVKASENWMPPVLELDVELRSRGVNPGAVADIVAETIALHLIRNVLEGREPLELSH
ncbi:MAG: triphosphoribosyl-dephospho-CoA synthase [Desulfurococcaceae archaeon]